MFFLESISNVCSDSSLGNILSLVRKIFTVIEAASPIVLIIILIVRFIGLMSNPEDKKGLGKIKNSIFACVVIFIIPTITNVVMSILDDSTFFSACWNSDFSGNYSQYIEIGNNKGPLLNDSSDYEKESSSSKNDNSNSGSKNNSSKGDNSNLSDNSDYHINSITKIKYNIYYQNDSKWGSVVYPGSSSTIAGIGCMLSSVAVVSSSFDSNITPYTVFNSYRHNNPRDSIPKLTNSNYSCYKGSTKKDDIIQALKKGDIVVTTVYGKKKNGASKFTSSQHYMALIDINNDSIFVGNGYSSSTHGRAGWFDTNEVLTSVVLADYCTPSSNLK